MGLVDYSSSSEDGGESTNNPPSNTSLKRKHSETSDLPPLPSKFHDLYASTTRLSTRDDPSLHGGRKRVTPHVDGNWPSHVYIEWYPSTTEHACLSNLISTLKEDLLGEKDSVVVRGGEKIETFLTSELGAPLPLHISLSRPIGFLTEKKDVFLSSLERSIKTSGVKPFKVTFSSLQWVSNFESTRWFLVLKVEKPEGDSLNKLLHLTNTVVQENGQPPLYTPPTTKAPSTTHNSKKSKHRQTRPAVDWSNIPDMTEAFHFSIAWSLTPPSEEVKEATRSVMEKWAKDVEGISVSIGEVKVKIGNVVTSVELVIGAVESGGLFGL